MNTEKTYSVRVTVYHGFTVKANSPEKAREEAEYVIWDDHVKDCIIDVEEETGSEPC